MHTVITEALIDSSFAIIVTDLLHHSLKAQFYAQILECLYIHRYLFRAETALLKQSK